MSKCFEDSSSMTGSTNSGPLQPQKDSSPLLARSSPFDFYTTPLSPSRRGHRQRHSRKMTLTSPNGQPVQLTPLWEHVVRTRKFPSEVDTRLTFLEISERLRDPEWEVRQHALRVLIDVLPTLNADIVDKVMQPVVPELVNNLGHPAPAVRKGALDALRVFLIHNRDRENTIKKMSTNRADDARTRGDLASSLPHYLIHTSIVKHGCIEGLHAFLQILQDGLNRSEVRDSFQTNVTTGVILSVPSLLFPSSSSPSPSDRLVKDATIALASRLAQVPHQEAVLKSLMKIREAVGTEGFENYLADYDNKLKRNIEILSKIYNVKSTKRARKRINVDGKNAGKAETKDSDRKWESDSDTSGIAEEEDEVNNGVMPAARVVLETEIKFNEETAITMTILEEKEDSDKEQDDESGTDVRNDTEAKDTSPDRRKTPRRVHFGGEIVKLRTPDSDDTESLEATPKTRIPIPVSPATKMLNTRKRPSSQPCSPRREPGKPKRTSRSVSSSPKREVYTHNAELSPKKSILARTSSPIVDKSVEQLRKKRNANRQDQKEKDNSTKEQSIELNRDNENLRITMIAGRIEDTKKEDVRLVQSSRSLASSNSVDSEDKGGRLGENRSESPAMKTIGGKSASKADAESSKYSKQLEDPGVQSKKETKHVQRKNLEEKVQISENVQGVDKLFASFVENDDEEQPNRATIDRDDGDRSFARNSKDDENDTSNRNAVKLKVCTTGKEGNVDGVLLGNVDGERTTKGDRDKTSASVIEKNSNAARGAGDATNTSAESSWEELGLVDQEVLEDLHNKEDWRARVRGFERVASALRTSSALIAIEPRLGSLLHAVLGSERSCRVAAAGLAVAKVVVAGVSEEALKKKLSQLAWGLTRQGGPSAAQLARIAMLRLRPALLLEQFLQPQCLNARNAKTRENTLQLLIFSLVTFPSTEFKVDAVSNKVARMVRDRRRRVRQAALDTLAVLAQIYESEEVLAAGKRASEGYHDGEAMISAIRARLARKSLPLVSADGLVMYGLQISPTVQIATGPDVDWIVAGSGSVSPGIGRTKGQIIATMSEKEKLARTEHANHNENPWIDRPNFVALGMGMRSKTDQPVVWQIVPTQNQNLQCEGEVNRQLTRDVNPDIRNGEGTSSNLNSKNQARLPVSTRESANYRNIVEENFERKEISSKPESRIPVLFARDRGPKTVSYNVDKSNFEFIGVQSRRKLRDTAVNAGHVNSQEENVRAGETMSRRKNNQAETSMSTHYDTYRSIKNLTNTDSNNVSEITSHQFLYGSPRVYQKLLEKNSYQRKLVSKYGRSNSIERNQPSLPRNVKQQTFIMHDMYNTVTNRERRFGDENAFQQLQTAPTPLTQTYNKIDFNQRSGEISDGNMLPRARFYRRTMDIAAQTNNDAELISSDAQDNEHFPAICVADGPYRRRLRSLSPSQLYHRQQFPRMASNELHAVSMYDIDKAVNEEEFNEKNKHHFLSDESYRVQTLDTIETQFEGSHAGTPLQTHKRELHPQNIDDNELSSSDALENNCEEDIGQDIHDTQDDSESRSSSPERPNVDSAFDIITGQSSPPDQDTVDFIISLDEKIETAAEPTIRSIEDDAGSKDWSSEEETKSRNQSRVSSRNSGRSQFRENQNDSEFSASDEAEGTDDRASAGRRSIVSVLTNERILAVENLQESTDDLRTDFQQVQVSPSRRSSSPKKSSRSSSRNSNEFETSKSPRRNSRSSSHKLSFDLENNESAESSEERAVSTTAQCENESLESVESSQSRRGSKNVESPTIIIASRPHSTETPNFIENHLETTVQLTENDDDNADRFINDSNGSNTLLDDEQCRDSSSETNMEPGILKIETESMEPMNLSKRVASKVPRMVRRYRKGNLEKPEKLKPIVQQCFTQLESKEWEITMKGLKALSQITKQQPEYLDVSNTATINRLLGRQIKSLRSQVARAACLAAGDIFSSQIRGIDQDFDDVAGSLLQRTADTNRFLRADSNAALDRMIEHLPSQKTIGVIIQRGASHQNAIVRAATARLLASIVDRIGPEHIMVLPKDVKDKLLNTGARLLIDGNLDARNYAKGMFRSLAICEGFQKALTDAVPETTLRHIDKTLKTL
ncbi:uncharacterized protein LOC143152802 isoform X2 [Ptiloglossa arizonensis]|uniref:uncharacterized protein LOC143152802 isoform X2 n=1 Tax=Ptiloglossa arizonensis TaxID=3350558 RepID=UPI003FA13CE9